MTKNNTDEIFNTIEQLRNEKYGDLPPELVSKLLRIEVEQVETETNNEVLRSIERLVEDYLATLGE